MTDQFESNTAENPEAPFTNEQIPGTQTASDWADHWQGMEVRQRLPDGTGQGEAEIAALSPDDADADSDLVRPSRATQFRTQRRAQFSALFPALLLIAAGVLLLVRPDVIVRRLVIGGAVAGLLLSLFLRFLFNGRRERGLFFITASPLMLFAFLRLVYFAL